MKSKLFAVALASAVLTSVVSQDLYAGRKDRLVNSDEYKEDFEKGIIDDYSEMVEGDGVEWCYIADGVKRLALWRKAIDRATGPSGKQLVADLREALAHDLDAPKALGIVDAWAVDESSEDEKSSATAHAAINSLLGVKL